MSAVELPAELVRIFREEAVEHLDGMVTCLLALEAGQMSGQATDALFRHAHSIKGSAGMVGLREAGTIAHAIEDVLQAARDAGHLSPTLVEPLLHATDSLRQAVTGQSMVAGRAVEELAARLPGGAPLPSNEPAIEKGAAMNHGGEIDSATPESSPVQRQEDESRVPKDMSITRSIRVPAHKVDLMLDTVSETVLHHRRLEHMLNGGPREAEEAVGQEVDRGERLLRDLQETVLELRMVPLSTITVPYARAVRDFAATAGKEIDLEITGAETQLDRVLLDGMSDAIGHLLRNAVVHGIELPTAREDAGKPRRGLLRLHAEPRGGQIAIEVHDDGGGVPAEAIAEGLRRGSLIDVLAEAGFSTAAGISEIAGRGVGLDAVKRQVESIGGNLMVETDAGKGTSVTLLLPVTLALLRVLILKRGSQRFGLPLASVSEAIAVEEVMILGGRASIMTGGGSLRLCDLASILDISAMDLPKASLALLVQASNGRVALACEQVISEEEVIVKPLGRPLAGVPGYLGAAILSDGAVVLILDPAHLVRQAPHTVATSRATLATKARRAPKVLVVDDQFTVRELQRSILRASGYQVEVACDGREALDTLETTGDFDIVVTDLQMPEMDGLELLATIRADPGHSSLPVVVVTSRGSEGDRKRGAEAGADAYIVKDEFDQHALLATVERLIGAR